MRLKPLPEVADILMRRRRLWVTFVFISICFFYVLVLRDRVHLSAVIPGPTTEPYSPVPIRLTTSKDADNECPSGNILYKNYCVISPYDEHERSTSNLRLVTLCTQGTVEFLHHVIALCNRWNGPMSVAVYSPPEDYADARNLVNSLRKCDFCVRHWVSWHFFFRKQQMPVVTNFQNSTDCRVIAAPVNSSTRKRFEGTYPINVGRDIARNKTSTPYVFSTDIELYPSAWVLPKFERMVRLSNTPSDRPQVWVLPVFEVHSKFKAPVTKAHLRSMYAGKQVISFHKFRCDECHRIPNLTQWMNHEPQPKPKADESTEELRVWTTVKRSKKFRLQYWEPFFIGTREDPEFDIRLSWEGKQNKMQVAYEMCLRDYDFHIVENAFLVHSPGINVYNASKEKGRLKYQHENDKWISVIRKKLAKKYNSIKNC